jgi:hypothetical protein
MDTLSKVYQTKLLDYHRDAALAAISESPETTINDFVEQIMKHQDLLQAIGNVTLQQLAKAMNQRKTTSREGRQDLDEAVTNLLHQRIGEELSVAEIQASINPEISTTSYRNTLKKLIEQKRVIETGNAKSRRYTSQKTN